MKRTDLAMIVLIAAVSAGIAYFVAHSVFGGVTTQSVKVKTIDPITSVIQAPDTNIFNANAINPAVEVSIPSTGSSATTTGATTGATDSTDSTGTTTDGSSSP